MNFVENVLRILADVVAGVLSKDEAKQRIAALDAADAVVDLAEEKKLGG